MKKQQENITRLLELIKENPELEIVPMVDCECVHHDGYAYWLGEWGTAEIDEYYSSDTDERIYFKSDDFEELVEKIIGRLSEEYGNFMDEELELLAEDEVNGLKWTKAIVVHINAL